MFGIGTANGAGFLAGTVARQVIRLVLVPVEHLYRQYRAPGRRHTDRHEAHTFDGYVN